MGTEEVIELSVPETQALRATLGLPPLRGIPGASSSAAVGAGGGDRAAINCNENGSGALSGGNDEPSTSTNKQEELALSIDETNALRLKLGLAPLKTSIDDQERGSSRATAIHAKPTDGRAEEEARRRIEDAAARREAKARLKKWEAEGAEEVAGSALDFAARMRASKKDKGAQDGELGDKGKKKRKKKKKLASNPQLSLPNDDDEEENNEGQYTSADLQGMKVAHAAADFESGATQVLTLADKSILDVDPDSNKVRGVDGEDTELINVNMEGDSKALENLRKKRQIELGAGRAGGYAGYDDDEFDETGGVGVVDGSGPLWHGAPGDKGTNSSKGFAIGADGTVKPSHESKKPDLFAALAGGAVSLQSRHAHTVASDFLSHDDDDEEREGRLAKEKARHAKMLEKMRKKDKKRKAKRKGRKRSESDDEDEETGGGGLLESLEATAVQKEGSEEGRKRRRRDGGEAVDGEGEASGHVEGAADDDEAGRRKRFDAIMDKGRQRTDRAFKKPVVQIASALHDDGGDDDGADDAFLNAALAKARRLKKLKEMGGADRTTANGAEGVPVKGEAAIVRAVERMKREEAGATDGTNNGAGGTGLTFEFDEVQEFTRALRAREEREKRSGGAAPARRGLRVSTAKETKTVKDEQNAAAPADEREGRVEDVDMQELAQEMKDDDNGDDDDDGRANHDEGEAFGSTAASAPVGRGMAGVLSLLKRTGEISHRAGREEMRGRAKDERTYEDYEKLDLDKVVRVDTHGRRAHEKDVELANREIKLEYRDGHGRLLTRKEAYREMCYQFHGHGSSKKNQERRLKQIEREQEEKGAGARGGTLGALKKTQEATGRAFVVHKT